MKTEFRTLGVVGLMILLMAAITGCAGDGANPSGTFEATTVDVASVIAGRVLAVGADEGEMVAAGDTLLVLDVGTMVLQRRETAAKQSSLAAERAVVEQDLRQAELRLELATTTLERTRNLESAGSATRQKVDDLSAEHDVAASRVEAADGRLAVLDAELAALDAGLAVFDRRIADGVVLSPLSAMVLVRAIEPGEVAAAGRTALRLADLSALELRVYLGEQDLDLVRPGDSLVVHVDALPGEALPGTVTWISDEAEFTPKNAQTRDAREQLVYAVKLAVANPDGRLHIGMPAEVDLP